VNRFTHTLTALGAFLALVASGGSASAQPAKAAPGAATTFIGTLPAEPPARVAVVVEGDKFLAYACGQTDDFNRAASAWFRGTVQNGRIEAKVDGKTLSAALADGTIRGSLAIEGREREFTAKPVPPKAIAGLYRATREGKDDTLVMGWIVDAQHQVVGGCQGKKRLPIALKPAKPLPPPPPHRAGRGGTGRRRAGRESYLRRQAARGQGRSRPEEVTS
jgi:hypothetical protein